MLYFEVVLLLSGIIPISPLSAQGVFCRALRDAPVWGLLGRAAIGGDEGQHRFGVALRLA